MDDLIEGLIKGAVIFLVIVWALIKIRFLTRSFLLHTTDIAIAVIIIIICLAINVKLKKG
jgi:hypothetical protein